ncbi:MAG: hypothetical protein Q4C78_01600 [Synergistaceae bacterium]|nr:hypothetical protein [Synergistaceae bacterium]
MKFVRKSLCSMLLIAIFATTLSFGVQKAYALTGADAAVTGIAVIGGAIDRSEKERKAKEEEKENQKKLDEQTRSEVRDYIFNKIIGMKKALQSNKEKQMWDGLAKQLQQNYKAFPKTEQTATKTIMTVSDRDKGVDITETIVYDKAANLITVTVEHKPGFKEEMSDKAK